MSKPVKNLNSERNLIGEFGALLTLVGGKHAAVLVLSELYSGPC